MAMIKVIDKSSVHQLQSGQVIVDLCSVVKELVENGLDAGATSIDVRFKNNGLDAIEVQDNGQGIAPEDFETVALKHYTSKLSTYDDLDLIQTFGFRGEALSSLCALSDFHITTARACDVPRGHHLSYEHSGQLRESSVTASQRGTSIVVEKIFNNLPVRRKELERNIKREYGKALGLLQAYACISTSVKFTVSNQMLKTNRAVAFSTRANSTSKENIVNVYGAKAVLLLVELDLTLRIQYTAGRGTHLGSTQTSNRDEIREVHVQGHISRPVVGEGRQLPDRQMFFVNSRPCALPQVAKAFNEVYRIYNVTQSPFIFANLRLDTNAYDVNVSPDKRTILLHDQAALLESLKTHLIELFDQHDQSVPQAAPIRDRAAQFTSTSSRKIAIEANKLGVQAEDAEACDPLDLSTSARLSEKSSIRTLPSPGESKNVDESDFAHSIRNGKAGTRFKGGQRSGSASPPSLVPASNALRDDIVILNAEITGPRLVPRINASKLASTDGNHTIARPCRVSADSDLQLSSSEEQIAPIRSSLSPPVPEPLQAASNRTRTPRLSGQVAKITVGGTTAHVAFGPQQVQRTVRAHSSDLDEETSAQGTTFSNLSIWHQLSKPSNRSDSDARDQNEEGDTPSSMSKDDFERSQENAAGRDIKNYTKRRRINSGTEEESSEDNMIVVSSANEIDGSEDDYIDEAERTRQEEEVRIQTLIAEAEAEAARPTEDNLTRAMKALKSRQRKDCTLQLVQRLDSSVIKIEKKLSILTSALNLAVERRKHLQSAAGKMSPEATRKSPEDRLSLKVSKSDFAKLRIVGQFNLGFIVALRPPTSEDEYKSSEDLFIIDQHAADEKYNFEQLAAKTIIENQQLVKPKTLELTSVEEEVVLNHPMTLIQNGFRVDTDILGSQPVGRRCKLIGLPMSKEVVFDLGDLEELIALLADNSSGETPCALDLESVESGHSAVYMTPSQPTNTKSRTPLLRPSKVRRLLAMRACRSSIMVGHTLNMLQMKRVAAHMGEMDKPWNCPHGRPTMRHLFALDNSKFSWKEGMGITGQDEEVAKISWADYAKGTMVRG